MRIENALPPIYAQSPVMHYSNPGLSLGRVQPQPQSVPGIIVDISPEGRAAYERSRMDGALNPAGGGSGIDAASPTECATCDSRRYQDVSDDASVSFQTPTHISPGASASAVAAHESEHVANEQAKAEQEGREIVSQSVTLNTSICPECKRVYVSGGVTRTVSRQADEAPAPAADQESAA